ncbi:MAG: radical SAM protein [Candidatus Pacebacteria bacterium]|nr:radical SAM protein [Candidatus Paceibacterota bacterium]
MKRLDIKTSFQCNNRCKFCIQGNKRLNRETKTTQEIKQILRDNSENFKEVVFTGGEVTIRADILELVKFAKKCGYVVVQIQSNGRMFSYFDFCQRIIDAGATEFAPAIHGSTAQVHDSLTCVEGSFDQTLQGIYNLKKLKQLVITNSVITKSNYKDLINLAKILIEAQVNSYQLAFMHINPIIQSNLDLINEIVPRYKDIKFYVEKALQLGIDAGIKSRVEAFPFCTLSEEYRDHISENYIPDTFFIEDKELKDFKKLKQAGAKITGANCQDCKFYGKCEGPWRDYPNIFGFDEFIPIK